MKEHFVLKVSTRLHIRALKLYERVGYQLVSCDYREYHSMLTFIRDAEIEERLLTAVRSNYGQAVELMKISLGGTVDANVPVSGMIVVDSLVENPGGYHQFKVYTEGRYVFIDCPDVICLGRPGGDTLFDAQ